MTVPGDVADASGVARRFVALPIPDHVRALALAASAPARAVAPDLTWTRPEGWHVTLAFLGDVADHDLPALTDALAAVAGATAPPDAGLAPAGRFGRHALWLGVTDRPRGAFTDLAAVVVAAIRTCGVGTATDLGDDHELRPHLTLARAAPRRDAAVDDAVVGAVAAVDARWSVDELQLVRSVRGDGPARYVADAAWPLLG